MKLAQELLGSIPSSSTSRRRAVPVGRERLGLPAAAVKREHQLRAEALAQRMLGDERLELADHLGVTTEREVGLDALLERCQA